MNPLFIYELLKQKVQWNTYLTPLKKINDYLQSFMSLEQKAVVIDGSKLQDIKELKICEQVVKPNGFTGLTTSKDVQTILVQITDLCKLKLPKEEHILLTLQIKEFKDKLPSQEEDLLQKKSDNNYMTSVSVPLGSQSISPEKKEVLSSLMNILEKEYNKADHKDGKLKKQVQNELGLMESEKNSFVQLIDTTDLKNDPTLCDASNQDFHNIVILTKIKKFRMIDQGKAFCIDVDVKSYYQQMKVITMDQLGPEKAYSIHRIQSDKEDKNGSGMMDSAREMVLESYIASLLSTIYKDSTEWKIQWFKVSNHLIVIKITNLKTNHKIFNEISIEDSDSISETCPKFSINPTVREFVWVNKYCKKAKEIKVSVLITGVEETQVIGLNVSSSKLEESKSPKDYENYRDQFAQKPQPTYYYVNPYYSYGGLYRYGDNKGIYGFPFTNIYNNNNSVVYAPPLVTSIVPTVPIVGQVIPPFTYTYPSVTPNTYSYVAPYSRIVRAQNPPSKEDQEEPKSSSTFPKTVNSLKELTGILVDQQPSALIMEKISNQMVRIQFEKDCLAETHFYALVDNKWYDFPTKDRKIC